MQYYNTTSSAGIHSDLNFSVYSANLTFDMENYTGSYNFSNESSISLPIDMKFNEGHLLAILIYSVLMCFSVIANVSVLTVILRLRWKQRRLNTVHLLLLHLTIADLLVALLMMPLEIAWNATVSWEGGDFLCRFFSFFRIFGLLLSGFILICISMDRYYAILYPLKSLPEESHHRARLMLTSAWVTSALCSLPQAFIFHVESHPQFPWYQQCVTFNSFPTWISELAYNFFGFGCLYGLPLLTIAFCYSRILWKIYKMNHQQRNHNDQHLRRSNTNALGRAKIRTLKMTVVIVATFFFCWTPYNIMCLWYWLDSKSASQVDQRVQKGLFLFACTNSCMNPLIYGIFQFRHVKEHVNGSSTQIHTSCSNGYSNNALLQQK